MRRAGVPRLAGVRDGDGTRWAKCPFKLRSMRMQSGWSTRVVEWGRAWPACATVMVAAGCSQGSPSTCTGTGPRSVMRAEWHCASRTARDRPICAAQGQGQGSGPREQGLRVRRARQAHLRGAGSGSGSGLGNEVLGLTVHRARQVHLRRVRVRAPRHAYQTCR